MSYNMIVRTAPCMHCGQTSEIKIPSKAYEAWRRGEHIQNAWPDASPTVREMLISGTHPECWDELFPNEEE